MIVRPTVPSRPVDTKVGLAELRALDPADIEAIRRVLVQQRR